MFTVFTIFVKEVIEFHILRHLTQFALKVLNRCSCALADHQGNYSTQSLNCGV